MTSLSSYKNYKEIGTQKEGFSGLDVSNDF